ncbi:hypothetical protein BH23ACT9_BH23ACT9_28190 [soil metagenome]
MVAAMLVVGLGPSPRAAVAQDPADVMVVVDVSGSMAEDDGTGRVRLDGARVAINTFARALPPHTRLGVRSYPGGPVDDEGCETGVSRYPAPGGLAPVDSTAISLLTRALVADGNTPTSAAMVAAAEDLRAAGGRGATMVLVSDGEANCGPDPCVTAQQLAAEGIQLTVHTVGFQISEAGRQSLECIAGATGGIYGDADDSEQLIQQLIDLSEVGLDLDVAFPERVSLVTGSDGGGDTAITATVRSSGSVRARDVEVRIEFAVEADDGTRSVAVVNPRHRVGNLAPGASRSVTWTFRPPLEFTDRAVAFTVTARSADGIRISREGSIDLLAAVDLADAGPIVRDVRRLTIMGDSYSAGEGAGNYLEGTEVVGNSCHRSLDTYLAPLLEGRVNLIACSGAVTADLFAPNQANAGEVRQLDAIHAGGTADAVVMTIGGNDVGFANVVRSCVLVPDCHGKPVRIICATGPPATSPLFIALPPSGCLPDGRYDETVLDGVAGLYEPLLRSYRAVDNVLNRANALRERGGPAPIIVLGYVSPIPANPIARGRCSAVLSPAEMVFLQSFVDALNQTIAAAVAEVAADGRPVHFVADVQDAFQPDHTYCDDDPFVNQLSAADNLLTDQLRPLNTIHVMGVGSVGPTTAQRQAAQEQIHPNAWGYQAITAALLRWSTSSDAPTTVTREGLPDPLQLTANPLVQVQMDAQDNPSIVLQGGSAIEVQAGGLVPGTEAAMYVHSAPQVLGVTRVDSDGTATVTGVLPPDLAPGGHLLRLDGTSADGEVVSRTALMDVTRPEHPWTQAVLITGVVLLAGSVLVVLWLLVSLVARRRRAGNDLSS